MSTSRAQMAENLGKSIDLISKIVEGKNNRIIGIMGPNGSGKTRLLNGISEKIGIPGRLLIPAQRVMQRVYNVHQTDKRLAGAAHEDTIKKAVDILMNKMPTNHSSRHDVGIRLNIDNIVPQIISRMHFDDKQSVYQYKDSLIKWDSEGGSIETKPIRPKSKISSVADKIGSIFGRECRIIIDEDSGSNIGVDFKHHGEWINLSKLSDGEQQIVLISILRMAQYEPSSIMLIDEPELHLNERLACDIWGKFESEFADCFMVYATHSVFFATRPEVERLFLLDMDGNIEEIGTPGFPSNSAVNSIIGSRIQFLRSGKKTIYCEDELSSMIIEDIMDGFNLDVRILPGHDLVESAIQSERIWKDLRTAGPKMAGILDRDAQSDAEVAGKEQGGIFCLPFYDAEAIFQQEEVGLWLINIPRGPDELITKEKFKDIIAECAEHRHSVTLQKHAAHITRKNQAIIKYQNGESGFSIKEIKLPPQIEAEFGKSIKSCQEALDRKNIGEISRLFFGKDMYRSFRVNIKNEFGIEIAEKPEIKYKELRKTEGFREQVRSIIALQKLRDKLVEYLKL